MITIYTDGSSRGNPGPGGWGAIIFTDKEVVEIGDADPHTTNNRMELTAAIQALSFLSKLEVNGGESEDIIIYTDSEYVMKGMTTWIYNWQKKGWRTAGKKPVLNQDLWQKLLLNANGKNIEWKYVAGHSGERLNDRCDEIATSFADGTAVTLYHGPKGKYR
ncbi:MAG: ribonuclease HI [bacterium]|nr:ribonuclease HI [bacterium]